MAERFSQPKTTMEEPLTATAQVPRLTASEAYSTWKTCPGKEHQQISGDFTCTFGIPSGEKTLNARS